MSIMDNIYIKERELLYMVLKPILNINCHSLWKCIWMYLLFIILHIYLMHILVWIVIFELKL